MSSEALAAAVVNHTSRSLSTSSACSDRSSKSLVVSAAHGRKTEHALSTDVGTCASDDEVNRQPRGDAEHPSNLITRSNDEIKLRASEGNATGNSSSTENKDAITKAFEHRKQPLMELVDSEEGYVRRLRLVKESYMPAAYRSSTNCESLPPTGPSGNAVNTDNIPPGGPTVPDNLVAKWRILWGNWLQLYEWHSSFLEKLQTLVDSDPDRIPKLLIDSRARLRSIYSKYCENQIKAAHIAEQHKDFFDEWRVHVGDKEDVVSHLMQPVQRIMRYQLPIKEIVKWTQRANLPSLAMWEKVLDLMKELPKDTQLILEAARIDGFPGVITALGTLRIRGDLLIAGLTRAQLAEPINANLKAVRFSSNRDSGNPTDSRLAVVGVSSSNNVASNDLSGEKAEQIASTADGQATGVSTSQPSSRLVSVSGTAPSATTVAGTTGAANTTGVGAANTVVATTLDAADASLDVLPLPGGQKFVESRLFLFDRMLVITEEVKVKRKGTSADAFAQSTYQFRAAVNVNKMRFEPHWYSISVVANDKGAAGASQLSIATLNNYDLSAVDDIRFALWDTTPGRDTVYIIDPRTVSTREAWVVHLRDIQNMQQQLLLALQDPTRFSSGGDEKWDDKASLGLTVNLTPATPKPQPPQEFGQVTAGDPSVLEKLQQRKWPSFTMRRSTRFSSTSSAAASTAVAAGAAQGSGSIRSQGRKARGRLEVNSTPLQSTGGGGSLLRSLSAERHHLVVHTPTPFSTDHAKGAYSTSPASPSDIPDATPRKLSSASLANATIHDQHQSSGDDPRLPIPTRKGQGSGQKKKGVFSFFGKHKQ